MSCSAIAVALMIVSADPTVVAAAPSAPAATMVTGMSVASEPLFADIIGRSRTLKGAVDQWLASGAAQDAAFASRPDFAAFRAEAAALSAKDMEGHVTLRERGTDGDLKCILRGMSEDLPVRVEALAGAAAPAERATVMAELAALLDDHAAVIEAPSQPPA